MRYLGDDIPIRLWPIGQIKRVTDDLAAKHMTDKRRLKRINSRRSRRRARLELRRCHG
jgi:hypothetical protein